MLFFYAHFSNAVVLEFAFGFYDEFFVWKKVNVQY